MGKAFQQFYTALDTCGSWYIVVDQSAYVGVIVPTDVILVEIAEKCRFEADETVDFRKAKYIGTLIESISIFGHHSA